MEYIASEYDVAVIGAGHAGCEAALSSARLGLKTIIFAINLDAIANMPCNPNIGGTAKGHLVKELDALGGEMGKVADATVLQSRMLNRSKGPAVYSLRVQADRRKYQMEMKKRLEREQNLDIKQAEIIEIRFENGNVSEVVTHIGAVYKVKAAIIATGTFLKGKIIIGDVSYEGGPDGLFPANRLSDCLRQNGIELLRFKTGTPARISGRSVDYSKMEVQEGDKVITPFSFETDFELKNQVCCHLTYTNDVTHTIIKENMHRSPLYSGKIEGTGPRYCPSIEDKIVRFSEKERHQVFIEPMGLDTDEMYVQGMSSSLPEDVQIAVYKSIVGLENVKVMRTAYAIEYDCIDPTQLYHTLEFKNHQGLYGCGQFNGTSGYEEAAAQGLIAGINAALKISGKQQLVLRRDEAYIGTLIDDLVTKGTKEPYRMMTSRSEYRLLLRQDNADLRLTPIGYEIGLISEERFRKFLIKKKRIEDELARIRKKVIAPSKKIDEILTEAGTVPLTTGAKFIDLLKRPNVTYDLIAQVDDEVIDLPFDVREQVEIQAKYEGYIKRQMLMADQFKKMENRLLPKDIDYASIRGLRLEAIQKLNKIRPLSIGQASRISGVSPADISVFLIYLEQNKL